MVFLRLAVGEKAKARERIDGDVKFFGKRREFPKHLETSEMKATKRPGKAWLLETARAVALELKPRCVGTRLRIRLPSRATRTHTDGWAAVIGNLGQNRPKLEIWLDHFARHGDRKLWACFSGGRRGLTTMTH
jgi:hypothetical protein